MTEPTWCPCFQAWQPQPNQCDANGCSELLASVREAFAPAETDLP